MAKHNEAPLSYSYETPPTVEHDCDYCGCTRVCVEMPTNGGGDFYLCYQCATNIADDLHETISRSASYAAAKADMAKAERNGIEKWQKRAAITERVATAAFRNIPTVTAKVSK